MRSEAGLACESTEIKSVAASDVQNHVTLRCGQHAGNAVQQWPSHTAIVQSPPRRHRFRSIARLLRSPILRLEQVDVSATRNVERMPARTENSTFLALQRQMAIPDGPESRYQTLHGVSRTIGSPIFHEHAFPNCGILATTPLIRYSSAEC